MIKAVSKLARAAAKTINGAMRESGILKDISENTKKPETKFEAKW